MDHCILLLKHLSYHMHFITNGFKRFSKTNSIGPRQHVHLSGSDYYTKMMRLAFLNLNLKPSSVKLYLCKRADFRSEYLLA